MRLQPVGVAVVGAGYWGPNLIRNLMRSPITELRRVCDLDVDRAIEVVGPPFAHLVTNELGGVLDDPTVEAVVVATPAGTHFDIAMAAIDAGRHVLVEKPLAATVAEGEKLVDAAADRGVVLMCDHTFCFTPAVQRMRDLVASGELGDVHYVDSVRINLGLVQPDIDVFWDLAPHDLSILDFVLPDGLRPVGVAARGADPIGAGKACLGYLTMPLPGGALAAAHVNWLSPTKIRRFVIGGSRRMVVWDDLNPSQRLSIYDKGVDHQGASAPDDRQLASRVSYRVGDVVAPALPETEALAGVVHELATAIRTGRAPATDGRAGLRVLRLLDAASRSLEANGALVSPGDPLRW